MLFSHVYSDAAKFKADWTSYTTLLGVNNHTPFKTDNSATRLISIDGLYSAFLYFLTPDQSDWQTTILNLNSDLE